MQGSIAVTASQVVDKINAAFTEVVRPPDDDFLHCSACEIWLERFLDSSAQKWQDLRSEDIAYEYAAPTAVTPAGFRFLLPAFMIWHVNNPTSSANTQEHLLYQLTLHGQSASETRPNFA